MVQKVVRAGTTGQGAGKEEQETESRGEHQVTCWWNEDGVMAGVDTAEAPESEAQATVGVQAQGHVTAGGGAGLEVRGSFTVSCVSEEQLDTLAPNPTSIAKQ